MAYPSSLFTACCCIIKASYKPYEILVFYIMFLSKVLQWFLTSVYRSRLLYLATAYGLIICMPLCAVLFVLTSVSFSSVLLTLILLSLVGMGGWRPPHESLLYLLMCFLSVALLMLDAGLPYLFSVYAIVYVGAVSTLFLFVIMLLGVQRANISPMTTASNSRIFFLVIALVIYFHFCASALSQASTFLVDSA